MACGVICWAWALGWRETPCFEPLHEKDFEARTPETDAPRPGNMSRPGSENWLHRATKGHFQALQAPRAPSFLEPPEPPPSEPKISWREVMLSRTRFGGPLAVNIGGRQVAQRLGSGERYERRDWGPVGDAKSMWSSTAPFRNPWGFWIPIYLVNAFKWFPHGFKVVRNGFCPSTGGCLGFGTSATRSGNGSSFSMERWLNRMEKESSPRQQV